MRDELASVEEIIEQARLGRMFILVDDQDRENEGDLVIPAQHAGPEAINFMARFGRGLICLALEQQRVIQLGLPLMTQHNTSRGQTNFTVSIEARSGITTGISAADRAKTIRVAIDPKSGPCDLATPGHVFPLAAREGGVLVRAGHTEAAVDIARLAGCRPAGVICEIMNDDGTMARLPGLVSFAHRHGLKIATIADLIHYRLRHETLVERIYESILDSRHGGRFQIYIYINKVSYAEHIALVKGDIRGCDPVLTRMHALDWLDDVLGQCSLRSASNLHTAMEKIARAGRGVVVVLRESRLTRLSEQVRKSERPEADTQVPQLRDYGIGAQILLDLGVHRLILLTDRRRSIVGLDGYRLHVDGYQSLSD